jgi:hypothetical protein
VAGDLGGESKLIGYISGRSGADMVIMLSGSLKGLIGVVSSVNANLGTAYRPLDITLSSSDRVVDLSDQDRVVVLEELNRSVVLEDEDMSLINDTVRLNAEFKDFDGITFVSPENVVLKIFDGKRVQIGENISVSPYATGKYQYDYTIPSTSTSPLYYEFSGTIGGKPVLGRKELIREWV